MSPVPAAIELVVFDMDGVLARLDRRKRLELLAEATGRDVDFLHAKLFASDFEPGAEAGMYATGEEYLAELCRRIDAPLGREDWIRARRDAMSVDRETLAIAEAVREVCGIAMLTNNGALLLESLPRILPDVYRVFGSRAHASCELRARKPDRAVFERLLERHGARADRSIFVDDDPEYVRGARGAGMHALDYRGPAALRSDLWALGIRASSES